MTTPDYDLIAPDASLATPADYETLDAQGKQAWIADRIEDTTYADVERPDPKMAPPGAMLAVVARRPVLERTIDRDDDLMEGDRPKIIHTVGAVAMIELEMLDEPTGFTGVLEPSARTIGLVRMSLAVPATRNKSITPGVGLKLFVDHKPSIDLLAMNHTVGQGRDFNLFSNTFTHDLRREHEELRPPQKLMKLFFERVVDEPRRLTIDHFGEVRSDGSEVSEPKVPHRLVFVPHPDIRDQFRNAQGEDFRDPLQRIPTGSRLWRVHAMRDENDDDGHPIGHIRMTGRFTCSYAGDRLFFRHHAVKKSAAQGAPTEQRLRS